MLALKLAGGSGIMLNLAHDNNDNGSELNHFVTHKQAA
jgi:hypothetical protein